jgi:flagellar biosynthetic protein FliR
MLLPGFGEVELPNLVRAGFAVVLTILLFPGITPLIPVPPLTEWSAFGMVAAEAITGLWLGWLTRVLIQALPVAGQIIASVIGMANILQPDPGLGPQTSAISRLLALAAPVLILSTGLYQLPISAVAGSFRLIAPGTLLPASDTAEQVTGVVAEAFALALRLAAPFVLAATLWQVALGILARLVPQLQIYFAAMPGQILGGITLLGLLGGALLSAWQEHVYAEFQHLPGL